MLLSSYFVPHSPVLIPRIGKQHVQSLAETTDVYEKIAEDIEHAKPDSLIVLSAHDLSGAEGLTLNMEQSYKLDLTEFGDLTTRQSWRPDVQTINHIVYEMGKVYDINLISHPTLDYGSSIPLHLLTQNLPAIKIVPITYGTLPLSEMFRFGKLLENELASLNKKFVIIATGDLSHKLTPESVSGFSKHAKEFDETIKKAFLDNTVNDLQSLDTEILNDVGQCGIRALLTLAGAMENKNSNTKMLSYESSLGIGYLAGMFELT